ncbi:MAG: indolepyruvate ferredoxin oxidoreductase family protein [Rhodospirillaceae bacterium]|nr:indolepyruvate ferredoxin oxidoreductase family protein [Rhodospirillaceae bacterium]
MKLAEVSLDDKYSAASGQVFLTGTQALVRLPMMQYQRDRAAELDTACFISGYRGSPLGNFDKALWQAKQFLERQNIHFQPGVNEDLAATSLWGTQQINLAGDGKHDGVFGIWYGKGPGVDRSIDVFKHANLAGTAPHGGVLAFAGDDHVCASSTTANQSEYDLRAAMMPVLNPSSVQEIIDLGLYGWALSRYSGLWVGFICIAETIDSSAIVAVDPERIQIKIPSDYDLPEGGLNIRWPDPPLVQEARLHDDKLDAARAFVRANKLDKVISDGPGRRFGIVTAGKAYLDVRQALDDLGLDLDDAKRLGLSIYKPAMTWPLEPVGVANFARGLDEVLVVEEKRGLIEGQLKDILFNVDADQRPRIFGKRDADGSDLLRAAGELDAGTVVTAMARRFGAADGFEAVSARATYLAQRAEALAQTEQAKVVRIPYFCSGCPHNSSTKVPEGSRALAGIGCHFMVQWMERDTATFTHMGGEGANWIGQAPFSKTGHIFQNIGDGTYFHSGSLAIRAAVAAGVNITFKVLYNDAVAMTGGQPMDGPLSVPRVTRQLQSEGIGKIAVVTDDPLKYPLEKQFAHGVTVHHRDELDQVQRDMRLWQGVSAIVYDQMCATERRRQRKRGLVPDPELRAIINPDVCEGCGDCSDASNCLSIVPTETEFGRKRRIDQSSCNKDYSCVNGFCPSFVMVKGGRLRKRKPTGAGDKLFAALPEPQIPSCETPYGIIITGVGGTGIVTLGALLGMAARLEGKGGTVLDKAGLAQKYGAVVSHVRIAKQPDDLHAVRIGANGAKLLLGCDLVVAASAESRARLAPGDSHAIINSNEAPTGDFTRDPDLVFPGADLQRLITETAGPGAADFVDATRLATGLVGDAIAANLFLLGFAYQRGLIPLSGQSIEQAISLNGVSVDANHRAFRWGRAAAHDLAAVTAQAGADSAQQNTPQDESLDALIARRAGDLTAYQNAAYGGRYRDFIAHVRRVEGQRTPGQEAFSDGVARAYHKLLAYKDEYEVARLYSDGRFRRHIAETFEGKFSLQFSLAPPLLAARDSETGVLKKRLYGPWMMSAYRLLAKFKFLRGTKLDPFGYMSERRAERSQIETYEATVRELLGDLTRDNHALAVEIARLPLKMRGFGHVKQASVEAATVREAELMKYWRDPPSQASAAE